MTTASDWSTLAAYTKQKYSQCGEEGIIERIFQLIGTSNKTAVEFGCGDGEHLSNTRLLYEQGWQVHMWDKNYESDQVKRHFITVDNINDLFDQYGIPHCFDLLSIDIDGNDYWIWKALKWEPRVVVIEFNGTRQLDQKCTIPYDPEFTECGTDYYGASFALLQELGKQKGYVPVCQIRNLNLFFVRKEIIPANQIPVVTYTPTQYHTPDKLGRKWEHI